MSKTRDWRKLVGEPNDVSVLTQQSTKPMRRIYPISRIASRYTQLGEGRASHIYPYAEFMRFVERVKRVHELNPAVIIRRGTTGLFASALGEDTPKELRKRLLKRRRYTKASIELERASKGRADKKNEERLEELKALESALTKKPKAKKKRRKPK